MQKNKKKKLNCRGNSALDLLMVLVVLVVFALSVFFGKMILNDLNTDLQTDDMLNNESKEVLNSQNESYSPLFDGLFVFLFILLWGLVLVSAFLIDAHPVFFIFMVILLIFSFVVAIYLGNTWEELITENEELVAVADTMPMTTWILNHLLMVAVVVGFSIVGVLFAKNRT